MTPNRAKITITNPCSENWNSMQVDAVGRFCQSCQKSVIDFTSKSDQEIKTFLKEKQGEHVCGRFHVHQVERIRIEIDRNILVSDIPFWQKFLVVVLVCFGPDFLGADFVFAQTEADSVPMITQQADSLDSIKVVAEADSTLAAGLDSIQKPVRTKKDEAKLICSIEGGYIGGAITLIGDYYLEEWEIPTPPLEIPFDENQSKKDDAASKTEIAKVPQNDPILPKHPHRKTPVPENAVIANNETRRKTRRS